MNPQKNQPREEARPSTTQQASSGDTSGDIYDSNHNTYYWRVRSFHFPSSILTVPRSLILFTLFRLLYSPHVFCLKQDRICYFSLGGGTLAQLLLNHLQYQSSSLLKVWRQQRILSNFYEAYAEKVVKLEEGRIGEDSKSTVLRVLIPSREYASFINACNQIFLY